MDVDAPVAGLAAGAGDPARDDRAAGQPRVAPVAGRARVGARPHCGIDRSVLDGSRAPAPVGRCDGSRRHGTRPAPAPQRTPGAHARTAAGAVAALNKASTTVRGRRLPGTGGRRRRVSSAARPRGAPRPPGPRAAAAPRGYPRRSRSIPPPGSWGSTTWVGRRARTACSRPGGRVGRLDAHHLGAQVHRVVQRLLEVAPPVERQPRRSPGCPPPPRSARRGAPTASRAARRTAPATTRLPSTSTRTRSVTSATGMRRRASSWPSTRLRDDPQRDLAQRRQVGLGEEAVERDRRPLGRVDVAVAHPLAQRVRAHVHELDLVGVAGAPRRAGAR